MEEDCIQPSDPETQVPDDRPGSTTRHAYTVKVFAACPGRDATQARTLLGRVRIRPGPVAPGHIAAVRTPDGPLTLWRICYGREQGLGEVVYLHAPEGGGARRYSLGDVTIEGAVVCACRAGEDCPCAEG